MNTKERIREQIIKILDNTVGIVANDSISDQLLGLFLSEEEIEKIIDYHTYPRRGDCHKLFLTIDDKKRLVSALSTTLKPSWTELELDKILPKKQEMWVMMGTEAKTIQQSYRNEGYLHSDYHR